MFILYSHIGIPYFTYKLRQDGHITKPFWQWLYVSNLASIHKDILHNHLYDFYVTLPWAANKRDKLHTT
jgi:hypothetical protein